MVKAKDILPSQDNQQVDPLLGIKLSNKDYRRETEPPLDIEHIKRVTLLALRNAPPELQAYFHILRTESDDANTPVINISLNEDDHTIDIQTNSILAMAEALGPELLGAVPVEQLLGEQLSILNTDIVGNYLERDIVEALAISQFTSRHQELQTKAWTLKRLLEIMYRREKKHHPAEAVDHPAEAVDHPAEAVDHPAEAVDHPAEAFSIWGNDRVATVEEIRQIEKIFSPDHVSALQQARVIPPNIAISDPVFRVDDEYFTIYGDQYDGVYRQNAIFALASVCNLAHYLQIEKLDQMPRLSSLWFSLMALRDKIISDLANQLPIDPDCLLRLDKTIAPYKLESISEQQDPKLFLQEILSQGFSNPEKLLTIEQEELPEYLAGLKKQDLLLWQSLPRLGKLISILSELIDRNRQKLGTRSYDPDPKANAIIKPQLPYNEKTDLDIRDVAAALAPGSYAITRGSDGKLSEQLAAYFQNPKLTVGNLAVKLYKAVSEELTAINALSGSPLPEVSRVKLLEYFQDLFTHKDKGNIPIFTMPPANNFPEFIINIFQQAYNKGFFRTSSPNKEFTDLLIATVIGELRNNPRWAQTLYPLLDTDNPNILELLRALRLAKKEFPSRTTTRVFLADEHETAKRQIEYVIRPRQVEAIIARDWGSHPRFRAIAEWTCAAAMGSEPSTLVLMGASQAGKTHMVEQIVLATALAARDVKGDLPEIAYGVFPAYNLVEAGIVGTNVNAAVIECVLRAITGYYQAKGNPDFSKIDGIRLLTDDSPEGRARRTALMDQLIIFVNLDEGLNMIFEQTLNPPKENGGGKNGVIDELLTLLSPGQKVTGHVQVTAQQHLPVELSNKNLRFIFTGSGSNHLPRLWELCREMGITTEIPANLSRTERFYPPITLDVLKRVLAARGGDFANRVSRFVNLGNLTADELEKAWYDRVQGTLIDKPFGEYCAHFGIPNVRGIILSSNAKKEIRQAIMGDLRGQYARLRVIAQAINAAIRYSFDEKNVLMENLLTTSEGNYFQLNSLKDSGVLKRMADY